MGCCTIGLFSSTSGISTALDSSAGSFQKPLVLFCDASPYGVGAVISHGEEKPTAYASNMEGLAILFGVKRFLESSSLTLITSHSNISLMKNELFLKWLQSFATS